MRMVALLSLLVFAACDDAKRQEVASTPSADETPVDAASIVSGVQAYEQVCAGCHEEGVGGAPRTGDREAWDDRSTLWEAVLFEHAREGYLGMPAKGGEEKLSDAVVTRAAEYMLSLTYPEARRN